MQRIAGADGCRAGWLVVEARENLSDAGFRIAPNWNEADSNARIIAVDMPIGLSASGVRRCEAEARKLLSPFASRVFKTMPRGALRFAQNDWATANRWARAQGFGGISKQIWNIRPKIKEIDAVIAPEDQRRIYEAHPELAFARLNGGRALASKHTGEGCKARARLLRQAGFGDIDRWLKSLSRRHAKADDLLDACALVVTAQHILRGRERQVPEVVERDRRGLRMSISF
jgi:predicted RNase H-like nuclease